jgi:hypothetical protein
MQLEDALLEEYKTVRQESLESAARIQSVAQYLLAALGVVVTVAIVAAKDDATVGAAVVMSLIPISVVFGIAMMTLEIQRVLSSRKHLRQLQTRINEKLALDGDGGLSWETERLSKELRPLNPFPIVLGIAVVGILVAPFIGGLLLREDLTTWYWRGAVADAVLAVGVAVAWCFIYPTLRGLQKDE